MQLFFKKRRDFDQHFTAIIFHTHTRFENFLIIFVNIFIGYVFMQKAFYFILFLFVF